jgi:hypothetical protein
MKKLKYIENNAIIPVAIIVAMFLYSKVKRGLFRGWSGGVNGIMTSHYLDYCDKRHGANSGSLTENFGIIYIHRLILEALLHFEPF